MTEAAMEETNSMAKKRKASRKPTKHSPETKKAAQKMLKEGVSNNAISKKLGVAYSTVLSWRPKTADGKAKIGKRGTPRVKEVKALPVIQADKKRQPAALLAENATLKLFIRQAAQHLPKDLQDLASQLGIAV